jgi:hypothetical protein
MEQQAALFSTPPALTNGIPVVHQDYFGAQYQQQHQNQRAPTVAIVPSSTTPSPPLAPMAESPNTTTIACTSHTHSSTTTPSKEVTIKMATPTSVRHTKHSRRKSCSGDKTTVHPMAEFEDADDDSSSVTGKKRGSYMCRKCNVPKAGHDCPHRQKKSEEEKEYEKRTTRWVRGVSTQCDLQITTGAKPHHSGKFQQSFASAVRVIAARVWRN